MPDGRSEVPSPLRAAGLELVWPGGYRLEVPELVLPPSSLAVLGGPNGAGKTTLLKCLGGLLVPRSGQVWLEGRPLYGLLGSRTRVRRAAVYVGSSPLLFAGSVERNLLTVLRWRGRRGAAARRGAMAEAAAAGLGDLMERSRGELSAGQARRVALVRALVAEPKVLLLDEPESDLDAGGRNWLKTRIEAFLLQGGACIVATHHSDLWEPLSAVGLELRQVRPGSWRLVSG